MTFLTQRDHVVGMAQEHFINAIDQHIPLNAVPMMHFDVDFPSLRSTLFPSAPLASVIVPL
jgi:hypothetical protein